MSRGKLRLQYIGCGDAFGSGGRFNTCFHVTGESSNFLIDCGTSSLIALKKVGVDLNAIQAIFITHFHGDHFGGLPFFMLNAQFFSKRTDPLSIIGPPGLPGAYERAMETAFAGSSKTSPKFDLSLIELEPGSSASVGGVTVHPREVIHGNFGGPFLALRFEVEGRIIAYSGDTEWTDALIEVGRDADLFIAETYFFDRQVKFHLDLATLKEKLPLIRPKRWIATHMNDDMLGRLGSLDVETAEDGMIVEL